jgi:tetratricopeptide (TPR) repeat protein
MTKRALVLSALLVFIMSLTFYLDPAQIFRPDSNVPAQPKQSAEPQSEFAKENPLRAQFGVGDPGEIYSIVPRSYPLPTPEWYASQTQTYRKLLQQHQDGYTVLVVPFLPVGFADLNSRLYGAITLENLLEASGEKVVPVLYARNVLGMHMYRYNENDVYKLAEELKVNKIIWGYHNLRSGLKYSPDTGKPKKEYHTDFRIIQQERQPGASWLTDFKQATVKSVVCESSEVPSAKTPFEVLDACKAAIRKELGLTDPGANRGYESYSRFEIQQPAATLNRTIAADDHLNRALYLQWLAMLMPAESAYAKTDLFIASMSELQKTDPDAPGYKLLLARNSFHLGLRPMSARLVSHPTGPEEIAFRHFIDGNIGSLQAATALIPVSTNRLMAEIEYMDLYYKNFRKVQKEKAQQIAELAPVWNMELRKRLLDNDSWSQQSNHDLKEKLDTIYPVNGLSIQELEKAATNNPGSEDNTAKLETSFQQHIDIARQNNVAKDTGQYSLDDAYLLLLEATGQSNILRLVDFYLSIQGVPEAAEKLLDTTEPAFAGRPEFLSARIKLMTNDTRRKNTGATSSTKKPDEIDQILSRYYYPYNSMPGHADTYTAYLSGSTVAENLAWTNTLPSRELPDGSQAAGSEEDKALGQYILSRFEGSPNRTRMEIGLAKNAGDTAREEQLYKESLNNFPGEWAMYNAYAALLLKQGRFAEAEAVYNRFPYFFRENAAGINRVALSSYAYDAGNAFFWRGEWQKSIPFFTIAKELNTGSGAQYLSSAKLALLDNNYSEAKEFYLKNSSRYGHLYSGASSLSLARITGEDDPNGTFGDESLLETDKMFPWHYKLVSMRIHQANAQKNCGWLQDLDKISKGVASSENATHFLYLSNRIDRDIPAGNTGFQTCSSLPPNTKDQAEKYRVLFALSQQIKAGDFSSAKKSMDRLDGICEVQNRTGAHLIHDDFAPCNFSHYRAIIDAHINKTIDNIPLEQWMSNSSLAAVKNEPGYFTALKHAIAAASLRNNEQAVAALQQAFNAWPDIIGWTDYHLPFIYELLEFCERFYLETGDVRYKNLMVDWASRYQHLEPWQSWAYSVEARYNDDPKARQRALAIALYLDKDSSRLSGFSAEEQDAARKWFASHQPFKTVPGLSATRQKL